MIRLTITSESQTRTLTFEKPVVSIGTGNADVVLQEENLTETHISIHEQEGRFIVINVTNDPLVTLNSSPFWKKPINNQDRLQIGKTIIQFSGTPTIQKNEELEDLLRQVEELDNVKEEVLKKAAIVIDNTSSIDQEQSKIPDLDEIPTIPESRRHSFAHAMDSNNFRFYITIGLAVLVAFFLSSTIVFIRQNHQSHKEKIIAAEGVADVAMALTYAQVYHIKPQRQNWIDPEFLKTNLSSVLSLGYPSFANINNQGEFINCPYLLRIYTSSDLSQFLVIAQPEPSFLQWLVPKETIALDSKTMQLHAIDDIKSLNRLLASNNTFEEANTAEIIQFIEQSPTIPLDILGAKKGFIAPKTLSLMYPGAENYVYNAPRYYHFGEDLLKKAIVLMEDIGNTQEISRLQQEVAELARFPNFILYSSHGIEKALAAHKALYTLVPNHPFLAAYLSFNNKGMVASSHLLFDDDYRQNEIAEIDPETVISQADIDVHQLLLFQLKSLATEREQALKPISDDMITLLQSNTTGTAVAFIDRFKALWEQYQQLDAAQQTHINNTIRHLMEHHSDVSPQEFQHYMKAAGLSQYAERGLQ